MPRRQDAWSDIADELADWIEQTSDELATALMGNGPAPFAANLTQAQQLEFYTNAFFNPDGTPNLMGREQQMQRLGPAGYAQAMRVILQHRGTQNVLRREPTMSGAY